MDPLISMSGKNREGLIKLYMQLTENIKYKYGKSISKEKESYFNWDSFWKKTNGIREVINEARRF